MALKSSGPPAQLLGTVKPSGKAKAGAIPQADEGVIRSMQQAAVEGSDAGPGEGQHPPGSQRGNLPPDVRGLIADSGTHVP